MVVRSTQLHSGFGLSAPSRDPSDNLWTRLKPQVVKPQGRTYVKGGIVD